MTPPRPQPGKGASKAPSFRSNWERKIRDAQLASKGKASVLAVAFCMASYANADGTRIFPGEQRIAEGMGVSRSTVTRALADLRRDGWLVKVAEGNSRSGQADEYRLALPARASSVSDRESPPAVHDAWARAASGMGEAPPDQGPRQRHQTTTTSKATAVDTSDVWAGLDAEPVAGPPVRPSEIHVETADDEPDVDWEEIERRVELERAEQVPSRGSRYARLYG